MSRTHFKFNEQQYRLKLERTLTKEIIERLERYAKEEIASIGAEFESWNDTGNLLDSICWGIYHDGKLVRNGYYRQVGAMSDSYLHALSRPPKKVAVNGRFLAQEFLASYSPKSSKGFDIVFGILIPYWAYWEKGHYNRLLKQVVQFRVMSQHYDKIRARLAPPMRVTFEVHVPE